MLPSSGPSVTIFLLLYPLRLVSANPVQPPHKSAPTLHFVGGRLLVPPLAQTPAQSNQNLALLHTAHQAAEHKQYLAVQTHTTNAAKLSDAHGDLAGARAAARTSTLYGFSPQVQAESAQKVEHAARQIGVQHDATVRSRVDVMGRGAELARLHGSFHEHQEHHGEKVRTSSWPAPEAGTRLASEPRDGVAYANSRPWTRNERELHVSQAAVHPRPPRKEHVD